MSASVITATSVTCPEIRALNIEGPQTYMHSREPLMEFGRTRKSMPALS
jgi:hypothetical protein